MKKIGELFFLISVLIFINSTAEASEPRVQATADNNPIALGETVTITVSVSSEDSVDAQEPKIPQVEGLNLMNSWTSSSSSSRLIQGNGGMKFETVRRQDFNFTFAPTKTGQIQVGPFLVSVNGKIYSTKPFSLRVDSQGMPRRQAQNPANSEDPLDEAEAMFQQMLRQRGIAPPIMGGGHKLNHNPNESFFVQLDLDKTTAYEGEQITANWYIYTRGNILALDRVKFPDLKGFWKEIIEEVPALNFQQEVVNGVIYRKALLASHALFPIKAGTAVIDEYKVKAQVQVADSPFGFGPAYSYTRVSERTPIKVLPLPQEGRPADFTGAVGDFNVTASVEGQNFPMNQPFTLKVRFDGSGNAKNIDLPPLNLPAGTEIYDTKNESKFFKNGKSYKEFSVLIIPRQQGDVEIPALGASMFDPNSKKYYRKAAAPIKIHIGPPTSDVNSLAQTPFEKSAASSNDKKTQTAAPHLPPMIRAWQPKSEWLRTLFQLQNIVAIAVWLLALLLSLNKWRSVLWINKNQATLKSSIDARVKSCRKKIETSDWRGAGTEVSNLIYAILGELAGDKGGSTELQKLLDKAPPSIRRELGTQISQQIDLFQTVGFAPESATEGLRNKAQLNKELQAVSKTLYRALELGQRQ